MIIRQLQLKKKGTLPEGVADELDDYFAPIREMKSRPVSEMTSLEVYLEWTHLRTLGHGTSYEKEKRIEELERVMKGSRPFRRSAACT